MTTIIRNNIINGVKDLDSLTFMSGQPQGIEKAIIDAKKAFRQQHLRQIRDVTESKEDNAQLQRYLERKPMEEGRNRN